ncbi:MAG: YkgJ family cysteine cluster protein [Acidobacteria bacterium]|nr:YkgJ family cysteine cluster protein [Acidobacteriota bacterium]
MAAEPSVQEQILNDYPRMSPDESFTFQCHQGLECFTRCCRDVSIVLTPYDVLRLKHALGIESSEFLTRHTISPFTADQKFPAVLLKMDQETKTCAFVGPEGCRVYRDRPWACRMYPLGVAEPRCETPTDHPFHFLLWEDVCQGHHQGPTTTVRQWIDEQGIAEYDMMGTSFKALMLDEFWDKTDGLSPQQMEMYYMASFDLDRFRRFVFESRFLQMFEVDEARVDAMRTNDEDLLEFAMQWLRFTLFNEKTMKITPAVLEAKRQAMTAATGQNAG